VLAGSGVVVAVAIAAAVQLGGRRPAAPAADGAAVPASAAAPVAAVPSTVPAKQSTDPSEVIIDSPKSAASATPPVVVGGGTAAPSVTPSEAAKADATKPDSAAKPVVPDRASLADAAASAARARPPGRPVPRVEDAAASSAIGSATAPRPNDATTASPPAPVYPQQPAPGDRTTRPQPQPRDSYAAPRHEETAGEVCARQGGGFFSINVCKDEKCEEPRYRNTGDCPTVLARKRQREH
jgi:hypothetical protein